MKCQTIHTANRCVAFVAKLNRINNFKNTKEMNLKLYKYIGTKIRPTELRLLIKYLFRIKRLDIQLSNKLNYFIDPISDLGLKLLEYGEYEPIMTKAIIGILEENDCFIDLGSNEGYFSIIASEKCGKKGQVFAIEPQKRLWEIILKNSLLNYQKNIWLLPFGIGSKKQKLTLNLYPSTNSGASSFSNKFNFNISFKWFRKAIYGTQSVQIVSLDMLQDTFPLNVKLIKIDIEGFEYEALKGAENILKGKIIKNFLIEIHPTALESMHQSENDIDAIFKKNGYLKSIISSNLNLYYI